LRDAAVSKFQETIQVKKARLVEAVVETVEEEQELDGPNFGQRFVQGFATGGPIGGVLNSFFGSSSSTIKVQKQVIKTPAKLVEDTVDKTVNKFRLDFGALEADTLPKVTQACNAFSDWYISETYKAVDTIGKIVEDYYIKKLKDLIQGLQNDLQKHNASASDQAKHLQLLTQLKTDVAAFHTHLGNPIEQIII